MPDWDDLRFLLAVERVGSLAAAAAALGVDKATVSRRIDALEEAWGLRVLERRGTGSRVAPEAQPLVEVAAQVEALLRGAEAKLGDRGARGRVALTLPAFVSAVLVVPALPRFGADFPGLQLELLSSDRLLDLARGEADVALRNVRADQPGLVSRRIGAIQYAMYASPRYLERAGTPASVEDLAGHAAVIGLREPRVATGFRWLPEKIGTVAFAASDLREQQNLVVAGLGVGVFARIAGDADPGLRRLSAFPTTQDDVWLQWPEELRGVRRVNAVLDFVSALFQERRAELAPEPRWRRPRDQSQRGASPVLQASARTTTDSARAAPPPVTKR